MENNSRKYDLESSPNVSDILHEYSNLKSDDSNDSSGETAHAEQPSQNSVFKVTKIEAASDDNDEFAEAQVPIVGDQVNSSDGKASANSIHDISDTDEEFFDAESRQTTAKKRQHDKNPPEDIQAKRRRSESPSVKPRVYTYHQKNYIHAKGNTVCLEIGYV